MDDPPLQTAVPAPFDSPDKADLVIRTSNEQHLFVRKALLMHSSVFFDNLLTDSSPDETYENLPMHRVPEDTRTMCGVLRLCYPVADTSWDPIGEILAAPILPALKKYIMDDAEQRLRIIVAQSSNLKQNEPLKAFAIARHLGLNDVAREVAKNLLSIPLRKQELVKELRAISGFDLQLLFDYYFKCCDAAVRVVQFQDEGLIIYGPVGGAREEAIWKSLGAYKAPERLEIDQGAAGNQQMWVVHGCFGDIIRNALHHCIFEKVAKGCHRPKGLQVHQKAHNPS